MNWTKRHTSLVLLILIGSVVCNGALALDSSSTNPQRVPTLDELLGLQETDQLEDTTEIDQALSAKQAGEAFVEAVGLMGDAADRVDGARDFGLTTQRMQEDILRKLDQIIESAQNNQSSGSSGSSSSSSSSQQQQPDQQQQQGSTPSSGSGSPTDGSTPPGSTEVGSNNLNNTTAKWGHLPHRIREALSQGLDEPYSQLYRRLTEQYYKALAEDEE